jgi:hypothetical protein
MAVAIEPPPTFLGSLGEFENHRERGLPQLFESRAPVVRDGFQSYARNFETPGAAK